MRAKRVGLWLGGSVVALISLGLVGVGGGLVWVQTDGGERQVVRWINRALARSVDAGGIRIGEIDVGWGRVVLHDVRIDGAEHPGIVEIPRVAVELEMRPLLRRTIEVRSLLVDRPEIRVMMGADGVDLPTFASGEPSPPSDETTYLPAGWTLDLARLQVQGGALAVPSQDVALRGFDLEASVEADHDTVAVRDLLAIWHQSAPDLGPVQANLAGRLVNEDLERVYAQLGVRGARAEVTGSVAALLDPEAMDLDLDAAVTADGPTRQALAEAFGQTLPDTIVDTPPLTVAAELGGGLGSAAAALSAWWVDRPTLALEGLGPAVVTASVDGVLVSPWQAAFAVDIPQLEPLSPLQLPVEAGSVQATGAVGATPDGGVAGSAVVEGQGLVASGVAVDHLSIPVEVTLPPDQPTGIVGTLVAGGIRPSQAPVAVGRLTASYDLSIGDLVLGEIHAQTRNLDLGVSGQEIPLRGDLDVVLAPNQIRVRTQWIDRRSDDRRIGLLGRMNPESGAVQLDELVIRTAPDVVWRNPAPVTLVVDDGIRDLELTLDSAEGHLRVVGERIGADRIALQADAAVSLAHIAEAAEPFLAEDTLPALEGQLTARADVRIGEGVQPELLAVVRGFGVAVADQLSPSDLVVRAQVLHDQLQATAAVRQPDEDQPALTAEVALPLEPGLTTIACGGVGAALVELPATSWQALRGLAPALPEMPDDLPLPDLQAQAWATGDPCDPSVTLVATVDPGLPGVPAGVQLVAVDDAETHQLRIGGLARGPTADWAMMTATLDHPGLQAWAEAEDPAAAIGDWTADARILGFPMDLALDGAEGRVIGSASAVGQGTRLATTDGGLAWLDAVVETLPIPTAQVTWGTEGDRLAAGVDVRLSALAGLLAEGEIGLAALQDLQGDAPISARVLRGELPLELAESLSGGAVVDAGGIARIGGTVEGTLANPDADLALEVRNGAMTVTETGVRYSRLRIDAAVQDRTLTIERGRMASRPRYGRFAVTEGDDLDLRLEGTVTLDDQMQIQPDLRIRLDRFWAMASDTGMLQTSGQIRIGGTVPALQVTGNLAVDEGRFNLDRHLFMPATSATLHEDLVFDDGLPEILRQDEDEDAPPSLADAVEIDVDVDLGRPISLEATVPLLDDAVLPLAGVSDIQLDSAVEGEIGVVKTGEEVAVQGRLDATGTVELFGAEFTIEQGTIAFAGDDYTEPNLEFQLERQTNDYGTVLARVTGTPSRLQVSDLSSDEYEDQSDVMALLLFGRPLSELGAGQSQTGADVVQSALVNMAGAGLADAIGVQFVDKVDYTPGAGLSLGWSIGTDGFLTISLNPTAEFDENRTEAKLTWLLGRDTQTELVSGDAAVTSGWLQWERRF